MYTLLACQTSLLLGDDTAAAPREEDTDQETVPDAEDTDTGPEEREEAEFFDDTVLHVVDITLSEDAERSLGRDPYEYVEGSVVIDGDSFQSVGIRLRGKIGSFRTLDGKPKFKIDFNRYDPEERLGDYKAIGLNNEVVDCSYVKEPVGYSFFRQVGLPAPRTAFTEVTVNGEAYGLYVAVEYPDDQFLALNYQNADGNLYDGKYLYFADGSYELIDFTVTLVDNFRLEEGVDVALADITAVAEAVVASGSFEERMGPVLDLDTFHRHVAAEQWLGHIDGYATNTNNYRVYFDPADGNADLLVYDLDYAFLLADWWGMSWASPRGTLVSACWADAACVTRHKEVVAELTASVDVDALVAEHDRLVAMIETAAEDDPRRECRRRDIGTEQVRVRDWLTTASESIDTYWARR